MLPGSWQALRPEFPPAGCHLHVLWHEEPEVRLLGRLSDGGWPGVARPVASTPRFFLQRLPVFGQQLRRFPEKSKSKPEAEGTR